MSRGWTLAGRRRSSHRANLGQSPTRFEQPCTHSHEGRRLSESRSRCGPRTRTRLSWGGEHRECVGSADSSRDHRPAGSRKVHSRGEHRQAGRRPRVLGGLAARRDRSVRRAQRCRTSGRLRHLRRLLGSLLTRQLSSGNRPFAIASPRRRHRRLVGDRRPVLRATRHGRRRVLGRDSPPITDRWPHAETSLDGTRSIGPHVEFMKSEIQPLQVPHLESTPSRAPTSTCAPSCTTSPAERIRPQRIGDGAVQALPGSHPRSARWPVARSPGGRWGGSCSSTSASSSAASTAIGGTPLARATSFPHGPTGRADSSGIITPLSRD